MAVGRRAAADHRAAARPTQAPARVRRRGWPTTSSPAWASAPASRTDACPRRSPRRPPSATSRSSRSPTTCRSSRVTEKAFTHLVNEQYAVLQRAISAHERLERIVLSERGLDGVAAALSSLIGGAVAGLRRARRACSRGARSRASRPTTRGRRRWPPSCASAPARGAPPRLRAGGASCSRRARSRCRSRARPGGNGDRRRRRPGSSPSRTPAALTEFDRLTLHQAVTSSRSSCCAAASPTTPSAGWPATCSRRWSPASSAAPSSPAGWSRSGSATASACSCSPPPRAVARRGRGAR